MYTLQFNFIYICLVCECLKNHNTHMTSPSIPPYYLLQQGNWVEKIWFASTVKPFPAVGFAPIYLSLKSNVMMNMDVTCQRMLKIATENVCSTWEYLVAKCEKVRELQG